MKRLLWLIPGLAVSCAPPPQPWPCTGIAPGTVMITEVMANPAGPDGPGEWIELANTGEHAAHLGGMVLSVTRDAGRADGLMLPDLVLPPASRIVLSSATPASLPTFAAWSFDGLMSALPNTALTMELRCGGVIIDRASVPPPVAAHSQAVDRRREGDPAGNDHASSWCASTTMMNALEYGTPGRANDACPPPSGWCAGADAVTRPVHVPRPGEVRLTEIFPDPVSVPDADGEWVELTVAAGVDLAAVTIATNRHPAEAIAADGRCDAAPLQRLVVLRAGSTDRPLPVGLGNQGVTVTVFGPAGRLDEVSVPAAEPGASWMRDPEDPTNWCWSTVTGPRPPTPGDVNASCPAPGQIWCTDHGNWRPVRPPDPGDLLITEVMASPAVTRDTWGDWFEVLVVHESDLAGLGIHNDPSTDHADIRLAADDCRTVTAGTRLIFARSADPKRNGELPLPVAASPALPDRGMLMLTSADLPITSISWEPTPPGRTVQRDPVTGRWCSPASAMTGGTPGKPNLRCPSPQAPRPTTFGEVRFSELMIDGAGRDPDGEYIELFNGGSRTIDLFSCELQSGRQKPDRLPSIVMPPAERALLARSAAGLTTAAFAPDFTLANGQGSLLLRCGTRIIDAISWNDADWPIAAAVAWQRSSAAPAARPFDNRDWCPSTVGGPWGLGSPGLPNHPCPAPAAPRPASGDIIVTEIMHSPSGPDRAGEYVELFNVTSRIVDLLGCLLRRRNGAPFRFAESTPLSPGQRLVVAAPNRPARIHWTWSSGLVATRDQIELTCSAVLIDRVAWDTTARFPDGAEGASWQLDPRWRSATDNDFGPAWCRSYATLTTGGYGSPGRANAPCF